MRRTLVGIAIGALLVGAAWYVTRTGARNEDSVEEAAEHQPADDDERASDSVTLDAADRERVGIRVESLLAAQASPERKAYGRVIDPTPLAEAASTLAAARAASAAAAAEAARLHALHLDGRNVSERSLESAESAAAAAAASESAARARLLGTWGSSIAERSDLAAFWGALVAGRRRLLRLDLPAGEALSIEPAQARIESLMNDGANRAASAASAATAPAVIASLVGAAGTVDPGTQGRGFYFVVDAAQADLAPGRAITGYLPTGDPPNAGVLVPRDAVVRAEGRAWIWLEGDGGALLRTPVDLAQPLATGWLVADRELTGRTVVVAGAQELLSELLRDQLDSDEE